MNPGEVKTRAKDRTLTDQVRENPVDRYQRLFRATEAFFVALAAILVVVERVIDLLE